MFDVWSAPNSGATADVIGRPSWATSGLMRRNIGKLICANLISSATGRSWLEIWWSGVQLIEQHPGLLQIKRVKTLGEPPVDGGEQITGFGVFASVAPEARKACGSTKL